ncbi:MAG: phage virion morphogenesis protein [Comamonadaceae bacterium]|nr:phage virion morphogenesis protein [Comamonadaceae bacterium]
MLTITVDDSAFRSHMQELQKRLDNLTPVMEDIGNRMENAVRQRFATRTDPSGAPWAPWMQSTRESYPVAGTPAAKKYGAGNALLLDRYGDMLGSLNFQADPASVRVGFAQPYATYHEYGTKRMARRGMLTADPAQGRLGVADEAMVLDVITQWLAPKNGP